MRRLIAAAAALLALSAPVAAEPSHALSLFGDVKYDADFAHFDYANPDAPKGGRIAMTPWSTYFNQNFNTFNTLNGYVLRGDGPVGVGLIFASLMTAAEDEPATMYGYAARSVEIADDGATLLFALREEAAFHDGTPLRAEDVVFSIETLKRDGHPNIAGALSEVEAVAATDPLTVRITLGERRSKDLKLTVAGLPIFSKAYYEDRTFDAATLDRPLGSGLYEIGDFEQGRYIEYDRIEGHWAADLPVMKGRYNFDVVRFEFYRDRNVLFEGFKAGQQTVHEEFSSRSWATGYDFPAVKNGEVIRIVLPDERPSGAQGWFLNTRREAFADPRVREAIGLAFDFEWTNRNLFYGLYDRTHSYFQNSVMEAVGPPSPEEAALLEPYRDRLPEEVFGEPYIPPVSDGTGRDRSMLRRARTLFEEAGFTYGDDGMLLDPQGEPFTFEILDRSGSTFDRIVAPMMRNLERMGIEAVYREVDAAQYQARRNDYDYDMISGRFSSGIVLTEGLRRSYGSRGRDEPGTYNLSGIADPVVDGLIETILDAPTIEAQHVAARALDRVLRAGRYWVPQWYKGTHFMALRDVYERPRTAPTYAATGAMGTALSTWWADEGGMDALPEIVLGPDEMPADGPSAATRASD